VLALAVLAVAVGVGIARGPFSALHHSEAQRAHHHWRAFFAASSSAAVRAKAGRYADALHLARVGPSSAALLDRRRGRPWWARHYLVDLGVDRADVAAVKRDLAAARRAEAVVAKAAAEAAATEAAATGAVLLYPSHRPSPAFDRIAAPGMRPPAVASTTLLLAVAAYVVAMAAVLVGCFRAAAAAETSGRGDKLPWTLAK